MRVPRLAVSADGSQLAMIEEDRVTVIDVATMRARAEIGLAGRSEDNDVALVGIPARLAVITRLETETRIFLVDPAGPEKLGEASTRAQMRLAAVAADSVLLIGATTALVDLRSLERPAAPLPTRGAVTAAGSLGDARIVLVIAGALEEWDAATRSPARRLRLDRPLDVLAIGGSERRIWMVLRSTPTQIEIINVANRSTTVVQLPEPIERLHAHPINDVLVVVGATTRTAYTVRTAERDAVTRLDRGPVHDAVWAGNQLAVWPVDGYPELLGAPIDLGASAVADGDEPAAEDEATATATPERPGSTLSQPTFSERLAQWKSKRDESRVAAPTAEPASSPASEATPAVLERRASGGWRGEVAAWARAILGRSHRPLPYLDPGPIDDLMVRCELQADLRPAIVLLYGAHLTAAAVARVDVASVLDWRWDELATGALATSGLVRSRKDRLALVPEATRVLDGRPPRCGTLVGTGAGEPGTSALVAPATVDTQAIAAWGASLAGAPLFVATERGRARLDRFLLEARIRGAIPVVPDDDTAARHGLVVAGRWPGLGVA